MSGVKLLIKSSSSSNSEKRLIFPPICKDVNFFYSFRCFTNNVIEEIEWFSLKFNFKLCNSLRVKIV
jgi:hypothetical protein